MRFKTACYHRRRDYNTISKSKRKISTLSESCDSVNPESFIKKRVMNYEQFFQSCNNDRTHELLNELNRLNQTYTENLKLSIIILTDFYIIFVIP